MGVSSFKFFIHLLCEWAPKDAPIKAIQGHPRSIILASIESAYATSY